jgi:hypothetical protein
MAAPTGERVAAAARQVKENCGDELAATHASAAGASVT